MEFQRPDDVTSPARAPRMNGQTFGNYQLLKKLATGGMAEVWLARHVGIEGFSRLLVVKRILPHLADDPEFVQMFLNEAKIAARFSHPNIAQIYDLGEKNGTYFIAMEFVHGEDLGRVMRKAWSTGQWIARPLAIRIVASACEGLYYAHAKTDDRGNPLKVVHRDVSPQNILISFDGSVKLVDFGIAKAADAQSMTRSGAIKGKFAYMAPEQAGGRAIDHRSDIFAIGLVLYELLTGVRPLKKDSELATLQAAMQCDIVPPSMVADVPPELDDVVMTALARNPDQRYRDAREFQMALEEFLVSQRWVATSVQISELMGTLFQDRLDEEAKLGYPDPSLDESGSSSSPGTPAVSTAPQANAPVSRQAHGGSGASTHPGSPAAELSWEAPPATEAVPSSRSEQRRSSTSAAVRAAPPVEVPTWEAPPATQAEGARRATGETRAAEVAALRRNTSERGSGPRHSRVDAPRVDDAGASVRRTSTRGIESLSAPPDRPRRSRSGVAAAPVHEADEGQETVLEGGGRSEKVGGEPRRRSGQFSLGGQRRSTSPVSVPRAPAREDPDAGDDEESWRPKPTRSAALEAALAAQRRRTLTPILWGVLLAVAAGAGYLYRAQILEVLASRAADGVPVTVDSNVPLDVYVEHTGHAGRTERTYLGRTPIDRRSGAHVGDTLVLSNKSLGVRAEHTLTQDHPRIDHRVRTGYFAPHFTPQGLRDLELFLDGEQVGTFPGPKVELVEGRHTIEVRGMQLKQPVPIEVEVRAGTDASRRAFNLAREMH